MVSRRQPAVSDAFKDIWHQSGLGALQQVLEMKGQCACSSVA